jgi:predicted Zn-dependent peptidase
MKEINLENGIKIIVDKLPIDIIGIALLFNIGSIYEDKEYRGITNFENRIMFRSGNKKHILKTLGDNGSTYIIRTEESKSVFVIQTIKEKFKDIIDILYNCIINLQFENNEIENLKLEMLNIIEKTNANGFSKLMNLIPTSVYGYSDYGEQIIGYENTIKNINEKILEEYKRKYYTPDNLIIFLEGNVDEDDINLLIDYFSKIEGKREKIKNPSKDKGTNITDYTSRPDFTYYASSINIDAKKFPEYDPLIFLFTFGRDTLLNNILIKKYNISFNAAIRFLIYYDDEIILSFYLERINGNRIYQLNKAIEEFLNEIKSIDEKYIKKITYNFILDNYKVKFNLSERLFEDPLVLYPYTGKLFEDYNKELINRMMNIKSKDIDEFSKIVEKVVYDGNYVVINPLDKGMFI